MKDFDWNIGDLGNIETVDPIGRATPSPNFGDAK